MQRSQYLALGAQRVRVLRNRERVGIQLDHRVDGGPVLVQLVDAIDVETHELLGRDLTGSHRGLQLRDRLLGRVEGLRVRGQGQDGERRGHQYACHVGSLGVGGGRRHAYPGFCQPPEGLAPI